MYAFQRGETAFPSAFDYEFCSDDLVEKTSLRLRPRCSRRPRFRTWQTAELDFDDARSVCFDRLADRRGQFRRICCQEAFTAVRFRHRDEIRVHEVGFIRAAEVLIEITGNVAVRPIVEYHSDDVDAVFDRGGEFARGIQ